ncbi:hypothetical protein F2Q68_00003020 [Brassica cretica]|uniref:Uncharacterized protein n=1 Tax=Brassica cretica TaxID=69181 RepID=A0A8S9JIR4_BRACR|nr:hypothetical protein F2Q68_00003020 [Brassica cretica]
MLASLASEDVGGDLCLAVLGLKVLGLKVLPQWGGQRAPSLFPSPANHSTRAVVVLWSFLRPVLPSATLGRRANNR